MPITKSAKKSLKVSRTKRAQNRLKEVELERMLKKVTASTVNATVSKIDKAAKINIISKNKAARLKSQLVKKFGTPKAEKVKVQSPKSKPQSDSAKSKKTVKKTAKK